MAAFPNISLEQWLTFKTVVDEGGFARAAEVLNKSQSSISYTIARLNESLPTPVLHLQGRRAVMTQAGEALYSKAARLLQAAQNLEASAVCLADGWETEVILAVDALCPVMRVFCALQRFSSEHPHTRLRLLETSLSGTDEAILLKQADIVLTPNIPTGFLATPLATVTMLPVASPDHPLFAFDGPVSEEDLRSHRQIVVRDTGQKRSQDAGWLGSDQRWTVSHFSTSVAAVKAGLGFAFVPSHKIQDELDSGELKRIPLAAMSERRLPLHAVLVAQTSAGPAVQAVFAELVKSLKDSVDGRWVKGGH